MILHEWKTTDGPNVAQSGNQVEGTNQENNQAEDGKATQKKRREPPGTGHY